MTDHDDPALTAADASLRLAALMVGFRKLLVDGGFNPDVADDMAAGCLRFMFITAARKAGA